jgi:hypothetical protein
MRRTTRVLHVVAAAGLLAAALTGCGSADPPTLIAPARSCPG